MKLSEMDLNEFTIRRTTVKSTLIAFGIHRVLIPALLIFTKVTLPVFISEMMPSHKATVCLLMAYYRQGNQITHHVS